jgi:hypothetical protein
MQKSTVIRMGAAEWSVTITTAKGPLKFNLRSMSKDHRRVFHRHFMAAFRQINPYRPKAGATA